MGRELGRSSQHDLWLASGRASTAANHFAMSLRPSVVAPSEFKVTCTAGAQHSQSDVKRQVLFDA